MEVIVKTILGKSDESYLIYIDKLLAEDRREILSESEEEMFEYLKETFDEAEKFPTESYFLEQFPEYSIPLEASEDLNKHDLEIHFKKLVSKRSKQIVSRKVMEAASVINDEGFTDEVNEQLRQIYNLNRDVDLDESVFDIGTIRDIYERKKEEPIGLLTFVDEIDEKIGGLSYGTVNVLFGWTGSFKCVSEEERVPTSKGLLKMKEIYKRYQNGEEFEVLSEEGTRKITHAHNEGEKKSYKLKTNKGNRIETSPVHRFRVINKEGDIEWKEAQNINISDKVLMSKQKSIWGSEDYDKDLCYLHGLLLGDGWVYDRRSGSGIQTSISASKIDLENIGYKEIYDNVFKGDYGITEAEGRKDGYLNQLILRDNISNSKFVEEQFSYMKGKYAWEKELPEWIYKANKESVAELLSGLFDSDGHSPEDKNGIGFTSTSEDLAYGVATLLRNFGIRVSVNKYQHEEERPFYKVCVITLESKRKFMNEIGFRLDRKSENLHLEDSINNRDLLYNIKPILCEFAKEAIVSREMCDTFKFRYRDSVVTRKNLESISDFYLERNIKQYHPTLRYLLEHNVYIEEIVDKEESKCYMYDLTVEGSPTYVVNQFITHNTTFATNIGYNNAYKMGYNVVFVSLEVPKEDIIFNVLSRHSFDTKFGKYPYVGHDKIRKCLLSEEEEEFVFDTVLTDFEEESKGDLIILDETDFSEFSFPEIRKKLEEVDDRIDGGIDAIIWDNANLFKFSSMEDRWGMSQYDIVNEYVSWIRQLSIKWLKDKETGEYRQLVNIILAQANRKGWQKAVRRNGKYDLTAIAEANELERAAYRVFSIFTDENLKQSKECKLQILKNRSGPTIYEPVSVFADPEPYVIGDELSGFDDTISTDSFDDVFGDDDLGF